MPVKVSLASYSIRVRSKNTADHLLFGNVGPNGDLIEVIRNFFEALSIEHAHDADRSSLHGASVVDYDDECVWGLLNSGDYGYSSTLVDVNTNQNTFERGPEHAELLPYYFLLYAPPRKDKGILIVQRTGNLGILTVFQKSLLEYLSQQNLVLEKIDHVPSEIYDYVTRGSVREVVFRRFPLPPEHAELLGWDPNEVEEFADVRLVVKAKRRRMLPESRYLQERYSQLMEMEASNGPAVSDEDQMQMIVEYGGSKRTVYFDKPGKIAPYIDITSNVSLVNGHPTFDTIHATARILLVDILRQINELS